MPMPRSPMERRFWACWEARYPLLPLQPQVRLLGVPGRPVVDFLHAATRTVVEIDGLTWHNTPEDRAKDAARDVALIAAGYRVVRCTGREVYRDVAGCARRVYAAVSSVGTEAASALLGAATPAGQDG